MNTRPHIDRIYDHDNCDRYYEEVNIPPRLNYFNETVFLELFNQTRDMSGNFHSLSDYLTYQSFKISLPSSTEKKLCHKNWQLVGDRYVLKRHLIKVSDNIFMLNHYERSECIVMLIDFLKKTGRTVRELYLSVPKHRDVKAQTIFNNYRIKIDHPGFIEQALFDHEFMFVFKNFPKEKWNTLMQYTTNSVFPDSENCLLEKVAFPVYWFKGLILNR